MLALQLVMVVLFAVLLFSRPKSEVRFGPDKLFAEIGTIQNGGRYIDDSYGYQGYFVSTPKITLPRGSYTITLDAVNTANALNVLEVDRLSGGTAQTDGIVVLPAMNDPLSTQIWVYGSSAAISVKVFYQYGALTVRGIAITENRDISRMVLTALVVVLTIADALYWQFTKGCLRAGSGETRAVFFALAALVILCSLPLLRTGLREGHDLIYHLTRIEGLKEGLRGGQFPVRIHPQAINGYGYASSLFYPELFLYPSALLRLVGFPLQLCYKALVLLTNLLCVVCGYFGFRAIFQKRYVAVVGAALCAFANYRYINVYLRSAVGEALACSLFPLVLAALWLILLEPVESPEFKRGLIYGVLGYSGIIQSHIISCELIALLSILILLIGIRRVFEKKRFLMLAKTAGLTLAVNAWFLIPFLDVMRGEYVVNSATVSETINKIWDQALYPIQLFLIDVPAAGGSLPLESGPYGEMPFGIGLALFAGTAMFLLALVRRGALKERLIRAGLISLVLAGVFAFMTTWIFPWEMLATSAGVVGKLVNVMQFPWRLLSVVAVLLAFTGCVGAYYITACAAKLACAIVLSLAALFQVAVFMRGYASSFTAYGDYAIPSASIGNGEYLPTGCDASLLWNTWPSADNVEIADFEKRGLNVDLELANPQWEKGEKSAGTVTLPLLCYPG
ncbi:MAG: hypothetical protein RSB03_04925, partial [Oscillospiraceae bacterium]